MAKLNEIVTKTPLFEGAEKTSKEEKENLAKEEKEISVIGFAELTGEDGAYGVCSYNSGDGLRSMTISTIQLDKLKKAVEVVGTNEARTTDTEIYFAEPIDTTFKRVKCKTGSKSYYVFE